MPFRQRNPMDDHISTSNIENIEVYPNIKLHEVLKEKEKNFKVYTEIF